MKISGEFEIEILEDKLVNYLLSPTHRIGNHTTTPVTWTTFTIRNYPLGEIVFHVADAT